MEPKIRIYDKLEILFNQAKRPNNEEIERKMMEDEES